MVYFIFFLLGLLITTLPPCSSFHNTTAKSLPLTTCLDSERRALLSVKTDLGNASDFLSSWEGLDCCSWRGVTCHDITGHVIELHLGYPYFSYENQNSSNYPSLADLNHLRYLDLSGYDFCESSTTELIGSFDQLLYLNLSSTCLKEGWPLHRPANLSKLQSLDLHDCSTRMSFTWLPNLISLGYLNMGGLDLSKFEDLSNYLNMLPSLSELHLSRAFFWPISLPHVNLTSIVILDLSSIYIPVFPQWIFNISKLMHLNLAGTELQGALPAAIGNLKNLQYLDLSFNKFVGRLPESLRNLSSLKHLDISNNVFNYDIQTSIGNLHHLEYLDLSCNMFTGSITKLVDSLVNAQHMKPHLSTLRLGTNRLNGTIPESLSQLSKLEALDLSFNKLQGRIPRSLGSLKQLKYIDSSFNMLQGVIPRSLGSLKQLKHMSLSNNMLEGTVPEGFGSLLKLEVLNLSSNSLSGAISEVHLPFSLKELDFSYNRLKVTLQNNYILPFKAHRIMMCDCKLGPQFPSWLYNQTNLEELCISGANISDKFPSWFWNSSQFLTNMLNASYNYIRGQLPAIIPYFIALDLSFNKLEGNLPTMGYAPVQMKNDQSIFGIIDLSNNLFSGSIPVNFTKMHYFSVIDLSNNRLNGTITQAFCKAYFSEVLRLSSNNLSGQLPTCFNIYELWVLDISNNNFRGEIPQSKSDYCGLELLLMKNNNLSGIIPSSLGSCTGLIVLDLSMNKLSGALPNWKSTLLPSLKVLSFRSNFLTGRIALSLLNLTSLQLLDLAYNDLSGSLPSTFGVFPAMARMQNIVKPIFDANAINASQHSYTENVNWTTITVNTKGQKLEYNKFLSIVTSIDLSHNHLSGRIPTNLMKLQGLRSLSLSGNQFVENIPESVGNMVQLESLDLSANNLTGEIPNTMVSLTFLGYLNLSNNNLSGEIPKGGQLQTFYESSYEGNTYLCGSPSLKMCPMTTRVIAKKGVQHTGEDEDRLERLWIYVSFVFGFVVGFWIFVGSLLMNKAWRFRYFRVVDGYMISFK